MLAQRVKVLIALLVAMVLLVGAGVAYASNRSSETSIGGGDDADNAYQGSISAPGQNESSLQKLANIDRATAEQAALKAVPGTVHEAELETSDNGYVVYDIELAGKDGNNHEVKVDAGNGEILHQDLEDEPDEADEADEAGEREDSD
jgi:Peptidase propeptide and YPEB domain